MPLHTSLSPVIRRDQIAYGGAGSSAVPRRRLLAIPLTQACIDD